MTTPSATFMASTGTEANISQSSPLNNLYLIVIFLLYMCTHTQTHFLIKALLLVYSWCYGLARVWMPVSPPKFGWNPNVQCKGNRRWGFGRCLGHKGGVLMNGVSALIKEIPQSSLAPSTMWGHSEKLLVCNWQEGLHQPEPDPAGTLISDF